LTFTVGAASVTTPEDVLALIVTNPSPSNGPSATVNFTVVNIAPDFTVPTGSALYVQQGINKVDTFTGATQYAFIDGQTAITKNGVTSTPSVTVGSAPGYIPTIENFGIASGAATFTVGNTFEVVISNFTIGGNGGGSSAAFTYTVVRNAPTFTPPVDLTIPVGTARTLTLTGGLSYSFYSDTAVLLDIGGTVTIVTPSAQSDTQITFTIPRHLDKPLSELL
jgi:hypothetical protein